MRQVCTNVVPEVLTNEQKMKSVEILRDLLGPEFLKHVITGDEAWVYQHEPETEKKVSNGQKARRPDRRRQNHDSPKCEQF
jgi:hypothetical protein